MAGSNLFLCFTSQTDFCHINLPPVAGRLPGRESEQGRPTLHKSFSLVVRLSVLSAWSDVWISASLACGRDLTDTKKCSMCHLFLLTAHSDALSECEVKKQREYFTLPASTGSYSTLKTYILYCWSLILFKYSDVRFDGCHVFLFETLYPQNIIWTYA